MDLGTFGMGVSLIGGATMAVWNAIESFDCDEESPALVAAVDTKQPQVPGGAIIMDPILSQWFQDISRISEETSQPHLEASIKLANQIVQLSAAASLNSSRAPFAHYQLASESYSQVCRELDSFLKCVKVARCDILKQRLDLLGSIGGHEAVVNSASVLYDMSRGFLVDTKLVITNVQFRLHSLVKRIGLACRAGN